MQRVPFYLYRVSSSTTKRLLRSAILNQTLNNGNLFGDIVTKKFLNKPTQVRIKYR